MPSSLHPPGAVVAVLRSVANIASAPSVPVSAGVSTSGEGGCLLQQSADTAALQRVNTLTFSRPDTQTQRSHFYPQLPDMSRRRRREYNQEFAELLIFFCEQNIKVLKSVSSGAPEPDTRQHSHINRRGSGEQPWRSSWPPPSTQHQPTTSSPTLHWTRYIHFRIKLSFYICF